MEETNQTPDNRNAESPSPGKVDYNNQRNEAVTRWEPRLTYDKLSK